MQSSSSIALYHASSVYRVILRPVACSDLQLLSEKHLKHEEHCPVLCHSASSRLAGPLFRSVETHVIASPETSFPHLPSSRLAVLLQVVMAVVLAGEQSLN